MKSFVSMREVWRFVAVVGGTLTGIGAGFSSGAGAGADVLVVVAAVVVGAAGAGAVVVVLAGCLKYCGNTFGATHAQSIRKPIEIRTAVKIRFSISRDGVPTSRIEDVAAREAADAEPHSAQGSVLFDRLHHVDRAGRLEAAHRGEQRRKEPLVAAQQQDEEPAHGVTRR